MHEVGVIVEIRVNDVSTSFKYAGDVSGRIDHVILEIEGDDASGVRQASTSTSTLPSDNYSFKSVVRS